MLLDARATAHKPRSLNHQSAAALPLVSLTAWQALHERLRIDPGQKLLIHAGAGGVGHIAVQLAHLHGAQVITTAGRPESLAFCRAELGCEEVINYAAQDFVTRVHELTQGHGLCAVFDTVGGDVFSRSVECLAPYGQIATILASEPKAAAPLLLYRAITVHYEFMGVRVAHQRQPERQGAILRAIASLVDRGALRPHVSMNVPLAQLADAHRQVETGRTLGKVVIRVKD